MLLFQQTMDTMQPASEHCQWPGPAGVTNSFEYHCLSGPGMASFGTNQSPVHWQKLLYMRTVFSGQVFVRWEEPLTDQTKGCKRSIAVATV